MYDLQIFKEFLESWDKVREIENIAPVELQKTNIKEFLFVDSIFVIGVSFSFLTSLPVYQFISLVIVVTKTTPGLFFNSRIFILELRLGVKRVSL